MKRHVFGTFIAALSFATGLAAAAAVTTLTTKGRAPQSETIQAVAHSSDDGPVALSPLFESALKRVGPSGVRSKADEDDEALRPNSTSPYEIARVVNESKKSWDEEHVALRVDLGQIWKELNIPPDEFATCGGGECEADVARYELDGEPGKEAVLRLNMPHNFGRYLVYKRAGRGGWKLLGYADHDFNRYVDSSYNVVRAGGRNWLVIYGQEGSGSGFALYGETWYEVAHDGLREVLSYPVEGSLYPGQNTLGHEIKSEVVALGTKDGRASVTIRFGVTYQIFADFNSEPLNLFTNSQRARFVWDENARVFAFDAARSEITPEEMNVVAAGEVISELDAWDVFLKYNCGRIRKVAASGGRTKREQWLRGKTDLCDAASQK